MRTAFAIECQMLKDFVNRYMLMRGRKARFVPGWDTHGLPIELQVLQNMSEDERNVRHHLLLLFSTSAPPNSCSAQ